MSMAPEDPDEHEPQHAELDEPDGPNDGGELSQDDHDRLMSILNEGAEDHG